MSNIMFMHGGGPTAVINASLAGSLRELRDSGFAGKILFARFGTGGLLRGDVSGFPPITDDIIYRLARTPGSAIGTGRDHLEPEDYEEIARRLRELDCSMCIMTGGNGTMDTTRKLADVCEKYGITVCGTPKTMDNDLSVTDHAPGFPSAARYLAGSVREAAMDVRGLPIHVVVIEAFGRDAGWITASAAFAETGKYPGADMILLPETAFDEEKFLSRTEELYRKKGGVVVVASEGLRYADGTPIVKPVFQVGRSVYFGDVSSHLSQTITKKLGIKSRSEKPGILGRSSMAFQSDLDREEAMAVGAASVRAALEGRNGWMSIIKRTGDGEHYSSEAAISPILDEILEARQVPKEWIDEENWGMKKEFIDYAKPLIGDGLGDFVSFV